MAVTAGDRITRDDIERKLREVQGEAQAAGEAGKSYAVIGATVAAVAIVATAYLLGRRKGRKRTTVVEVRRV